MAVRDDQGAQGAETFEGVVAMLSRGFFVNGCLRGLGVAASDLLGLPDEVLEEVTLVLGKQQRLCLFNDVLEVRDQGLAFGRQLLGWRV